MKLFSENIGVANTNADLRILQNKFSSYDPAYICQASMMQRANEREWIEILWDQYKSYADPHFVSEFKRQFIQRSWELYLGATLLNRGFWLGENNGKGPDFDLHNENGDRLSWIEAVAVEQGVGDDRVPDVKWGSIQDVPEEKMMLRISNALVEKFKKYQVELQKGIVKRNESYVIAINRFKTGFLDPAIPLILKVLFGIGHLTLKLSVDGVRQEDPESFWSGRPTIANKSGKDIPMLFFADKEHTGISAVIYSVDSIINSPHVKDEMGEDLIIVHNPWATNPLPDGFFPFGDEYKAVGGYVEKIKERKRLDDSDLLYL